MPTYVGLGSRQTIASADQTGLNQGNFTNAFTSAVLGVSVAQFEVYHVVVTSIPAGAMATIYIGSRVYGFTNPDGGAEYDPNQPLLLNPGQELDFCWNVAASASPMPVVNVWLRYDPLVPGNRG